MFIEFFIFLPMRRLRKEILRICFNFSFMGLYFLGSYGSFCLNWFFHIRILLLNWWTHSTDYMWNLLYFIIHWEILLWFVWFSSAGLCCEKVFFLCRQSCDERTIFRCMGHLLILVEIIVDFEQFNFICTFANPLNFRIFVISLRLC